MSVPAWKQAIIERRKRHEDDQKKKQAEEEAYLATLPPWKRALFQKREKERRQKEEEKERARAEESCERSSSFQKRQQQLAHEREQRKTGAWGRRVTPPSPTAEAEDSGPTSPYSPPYDHSHHFFPTATNSQQPSHERSLRNSGRRASVTTVDAPVHVAEKVANTPMPPPQSAWESRPRASSKSSASSSAKKVISSVKKFDEIRTQSGNDMPAWKKALLQRRKEKAGVGGGGGGGEGEGQTHMPSEASLSLTRKESPQVGVEEEAAPSSESVSLLAIKRKPSPKDEVSRNVQEGSAGLPPLQRRQSPVEQMLPAKDHNLGRSSSPDTDYMAPQQHPHNQSERPPHGKTHPKKEAGQKSLDFRRKTSPVEVVGTRLRRSESPLETRDDVSSRVTSTDKSQEQSTAVDSSDKTETANKRPAPKRTAPVAPSNTNTRSAPLPPSQQKKAPSTRAQQQKPAPEIVNLGASEPPPLQSKVIQTEGITHRAPVYKEVGEWANVSEDDPRFLSLPMWKQALIKRRRADIAKRMGLTTSVDDVLLTNGPVRNQGTTSVPSQDHSALPWKNKMVQHKVERGSSSQSKVADREKKRLANKSATSNNTSSSTVKSLLGRFSPSPPPTTSPAPAITITSRSPSPSSYSTATPTATPTASSRPAPSSTGVPPTKSSAGGTTTTHATRRSFTWTPGEDSIPGETLSDDSSNEEEDETITNLDDDTSSSEEEKDKDDDSSGVVLLKPPQAISSPAAREGPERVRKTSSILIGTNHPKKHSLRRVAFSESDLTVEHYYPKYDYSDYEEIQDEVVTTGFSFSFWKSKEEVDAADSGGGGGGLSQRLHPSLRSPETDPDSYRYSSPSRDSTSATPGHTPLKPSGSSITTTTTTITLHNYKPSILSGYDNRHTLQDSFVEAMRNGEGGGGRGGGGGEGIEGEEGDDDNGGHIMPADGTSSSNFYASLSTDAAAMLW